MNETHENTEAKPTILVLYHRVDAPLEGPSLLQDLWSHLEILEQRLPETRWKYWSLPLKHGDEARFKEEVDQSLFWVLCTSAPFVATFINGCEQTPFLQAALERVPVFPLPVRATAHIDSALAPLAASAPGHERDQACVQMVLALENALRQHTTVTWNNWLELILPENSGTPVPHREMPQES